MIDSFLIRDSATPGSPETKRLPFNGSNHNQNRCCTVVYHLLRILLSTMP